MITLDDDTHFLSKGISRCCYYHPEDNDKCIKVFQSGPLARPHTITREINELKRLGKKQLMGLKVPKYFGSVETNKGQGYVFELIRDMDGTVSQTFKACVEEDPSQRESLKQSLYEVLLGNAPVLSDLNPGNVLIQQTPNAPRFALIEGLGEKTFINLASIIPFFARKKIKCKFHQFDNHLERLPNF